MNRRTFLTTSAQAALAAPLIGQTSVLPPGKAEHCIMIWLGGGMSQIDTFDPKAMGDPKAKPKLAGSNYAAIDTTVPGVRISEHLARTAREMEHVTAVRTVHHGVIDEHAAASLRMHTGRPVSGTIQYPSLGSLVSATRGALTPDMPAYLVIGYPSPMRGPGFLGSAHHYLYLTDTASGPPGLTRADGISVERAARRNALLATLRTGTTDTDYDAAIAQAQRLSGPEFMRVFDLAAEPADLRSSYGGEFGQRCLLARRFIQRGARFIEVAHNLNFTNGTGWDSHNEGQLSLHLLIRELDAALAVLIDDLRRLSLLDKTLIVVNTEFGRPPEFDAGGGRGHQGKTFSVVLAGGGLRHCGAYGVTDDFSRAPVTDPVTVPDLFATILAAMGVAPDTALHHDNRPVPVTDNGIPIRRLFA